MSIKIKNLEICDSCLNKICTYCNSAVNEHFHGLRSETTVCPVAILQDGPLDLAEEGIINDDKCINCGLCALSCNFYNNLDCETHNYLDNDFKDLSELQYNAIACSYLHRLIGFAANTNRNKALQFDGFVAHASGQEAFVEVDYKSDSLECVRRILGDRLLYSPSNREIKFGIIVLKDMPKKGSRDVYNLLDMLSKFPFTNDMKIYFTTFGVLRLLALNLPRNEFELSDILYDLINDTEEEYIERISIYIQDQDIISQLRTLISLN